MIFVRFFLFSLYKKCYCMEHFDPPDLGVLAPLLPGGVERRRIGKLELGMGKKSEIFMRELNSIVDNNDEERVEKEKKGG